MKLPTVEECTALFKQYHVPKNIVEHCRKVSKLAVSIAEGLKKRGIVIDVELVRIGALMHDWMKAVTLKQLGQNKYFRYTPTRDELASWKELRARFKGLHEAEIARELLKNTYPELGEFLIHERIIAHDLSIKRSWEEKVVHYADWRVLGDKVIPLHERMDDFFVRYRKKITDLGRWEKVKQAEQKAEKEISDALGVNVGEMTV
ncbi:HDIG domain-containing protein [Candidatus Woesearchaeota archaeon]|nr:HDIG domain-containing protein [Candidatus Woesearchaeota archaeon]